MASSRGREHIAVPTFVDNAAGEEPSRGHCRSGSGRRRVASRISRPAEPILVLLKQGHNAATALRDICMALGHHRARRVPAGAWEARLSSAMRTSVRTTLGAGEADAMTHVRLHSRHVGVQTDVFWAHAHDHCKVTGLVHAVFNKESLFAVITIS